MKTKLFSIILCSVLLVGCTSEYDSNDLKQSLDYSVKSLSKAVTDISTSSEFQALAAENGTDTRMMVQGDSVKTTGTGIVYPNFNTVLINLADIKGVYQCVWEKVTIPGVMYPVTRFYKKIGESEFMIVKLPANKVRFPNQLYDSVKIDTVKNMVEAKVTDYKLSIQPTTGKEYRMAASYTLNSEPLGAMKIDLTRNKVNGYNYSSEYILSSGYVVKKVANSGDTAVTAYSISKDSKVLYEEKVTTTRIPATIKHRERTYSLTVGNVQIVRQAGDKLDSAKVYLNGQLQTMAKVEVVALQPDSANQSVVEKKRDIKITFDDGTTTTVKTLIGDNIESIGKIFRTVHQANFSTAIIDRIAFNIFATKNAPVVTPPRK